MHTLVCRVFKWNYEQLLYGQTFLPTGIRFARANAPLRYTEQKKERYIKSSLKLRIFHLNIVKEFIVIYNHQCSMVDMSCRGDW